MGVLDRLALSDAQWKLISGLIIGRPDQRGSTGRDNRMFVEAVLWIVRTGAPWRDLPEIFGNGTAYSAVSAAGVRKESGSGSSSPCLMIQISNISSSIPPSSAFISMAAAEKGGS